MGAYFDDTEKNAARMFSEIKEEAGGVGCSRSKTPVTGGYN
jgi:hypothetical protein